jgi:hypothetical protein
MPSLRAPLLAFFGTMERGFQKKSFGAGQSNLPGSKDAMILGTYGTTEEFAERLDGRPYGEGHGLSRAESLLGACGFSR